MSETFAITLKSIRTSLGISEQLLALRAGFTSAESITAFETGEAIPSHRVIMESLSDALQCTIEEKHRLERAYRHSILAKHGLRASQAIQNRFDYID